jgi:uncharacterized phage protein gp47/JayE
MYENVTYEDILQRMLDRIPNNIDKREGSIIYDALAPAAVELQLMYIELDVIMNEAFADTASREYLIRRASERGIIPNPATNAILKGVFTPSNIDVLGERFSCGSLNYIAIEKIANGEYKMQCETAGANGNANFGQMIPIEYIEGLETAELTEILIHGEDEEDTEVFRNRYFQSFESQAFGGNIADYKQKTTSIEGVGGVKVVPVWNGGGTVKLTIIDGAYGVPTEGLIESVQNAIDPVGHSGEGVGIAPIGHVVTVFGVTGKTIDIVTNITYQSGWSWNSAKSYILNAIDLYFKELAKTWDGTENEGLTVRISQLESRLLACEGVLDVSGTTLNGSTTNMSLGVNEIPVRGSVNGN